MFEKIDKIISAKTDNPIELAKLIGSNGLGFFRGADFCGVDVRGLDLRGYDLSGADLKGISADEHTLADAPFLHEIRAFALFGLIDRVLEKFDEVNFDECYEELTTIRALSELERIGVPGNIECYFQDGMPELLEISANLTNSKLIRKALGRKSARPPSENSRRASNLNAMLQFQVEAITNTKPANECEISMVSADDYLVDHISIQWPSTIIFQRIETLIDRKLKLGVQFKTLAVPRRSRTINLEVCIRAEKVEVQLLASAPSEVMHDLNRTMLLSNPSSTSGT